MMSYYFYCDCCGEETRHELIRRDKNLYRCTRCGMVSQHLPEREITVKAIISSGPVSEVGRVNLKESDIVKIGDELVVETDEGFKIGEVKAIELKNRKRVGIASAVDVDTIWLRNVGEVEVKFSLHKKAVTTPYKMTTSGETEFRIGETIRIENLLFRITRMKLIDGRLLKRIGDSAKAKEIKRVYAIFERKLK